MVKAHIATGKDRRKGLSGVKSLPPDQALLLLNAPVIHMVGMRLPLDLVFIGWNQKIIKICTNVKPGMRLAGSVSARHCLEMASGSAKAYGLHKGQQLTW